MTPLTWNSKSRETTVYNEKSGQWSWGWGGVWTVVAGRTSEAEIMFQLLTYKLVTWRCPVCENHSSL